MLTIGRLIVREVELNVTFQIYNTVSCFSTKTLCLFKCIFLGKLAICQKDLLLLADYFPYNFL